MKYILLLAILTIALGCGKTSMPSEIGTNSESVLDKLTVKVKSDNFEVTDGMITAFDAYYVVDWGNDITEIKIITVKLVEPVPVGHLKVEDSVHIAISEKNADTWTAIILTDVETDIPAIPVLETLVDRLE